MYYSILRCLSMTVHAIYHTAKAHFFNKKLFHSYSENKNRIGGKSVKVRTRIAEKDDSRIIAMGSDIFGVDAGLMEKRLNLAEEVLLVCDDQDKIVGFLSYRLKEKNEFFIDMVAIDPFYQGRGIAQSFLPTLLDYAKDKGAISIGGMVYKKNERVLKLFKYWGFRIKRYYVDTVYIEKVI